MFHTRGRRVRLTLHDGAGESFLSAGTDLAEGRWVHLAARVNGSVVTLFEDGVKQVEADVVLHAAPEVDAPLRVGHTLGRSFDLLGQVDEVLLYRRPLGDSEVTALYDWYVDGDGDGSTGDDDCDDADDAIYPGAADPPGDGVDGDCDGTDPPALDSGGGTGATGVVAHTGSPTVAAHTGAPGETAAPTGARPVAVVDPGCGCVSANAPGWLLALAGGLAHRRRVQPPQAQ
jgi:MYXO-CTERM domain-containing protein